MYFWDYSPIKGSATEKPQPQCFEVSTVAIVTASAAFTCNFSRFQEIKP